MKLVLIRHGQTEWNLQRRIQGWLDSPLTDGALQQLEQMALPKLNKPRLFSSDLGRASESATIIARRTGVKVLFDDRLRERCFGVLQGEVIDQNESLQSYWQAYRSRYQRKLTVVPDVETEQQFERRIGSFLSELNMLPSDSDIVIVTHGEWLRACMNIVHGIPSWHSGCGIEANAKAILLELPQPEFAVD